MTNWRERCFELTEALCGYTLSQDDCLLVDRTRDALAQSEPEPGEVAELVAALKADAECVEVVHYDLCNMTAEQMRRAATLLQQLSTITTEDLKND